MYTDKSTYRYGIRLSLTFILAMLIGFGVLAPKVAAYFGCNHVCCSIPSGSHMQHDAVRISGPAHPSCCVQESSDTCQLCSSEETPSVELALQTVQSQDNPTANSVSAFQRNLLSDSAMQGVGGSGAASADRGSPPIYIQTLTLLI